MMNRKNVVLPVMLAVLGAAGAGPLQAQPRMNERPLGVYIDIAYINLSDPPRWMAIGPELEWRINRMLTVNPEVSLWFPDTFRGTIEVIPGLTANIRFNRFFLGGGFVGGVNAWTANEAGWLVPKLQMGLLMGPAKLALTIHIPGGRNDVAVGLTFGTRIGRPGGREPD
jgi:hypothetical protein